MNFETDGGTLDGVLIDQAVGPSIDTWVCPVVQAAGDFGDPGF